MATNRRHRHTAPIAALQPLTYRIRDVQQLFGVSRSTVCRWIEAGELDTMKRPGARNAAVLIPSASVAAFYDRYYAERVTA